ncbi:MAG: DUF2490 domain-containing protein [Planctomycetes bacterium]|nr:DUF2490 domain-containing protein [Planctomycetota bacterium]
MSSASASGFEYWPKAIVTIPINEQWQVGFEEWLSFTDNVTRFKDSQTDVWVNYLGLADWLSVAAGYKRIFAKPDDDWESEDRPYLNVAVKAKVGGFGVVDRSRFEYRMPQDEPVFWRYRHRLNLRSPVTFTSLQIQPYTADEVFYSFDGQGFNEHRLYGGVFLRLHEKVRLDLFYVWKLNKDDHNWRTTNVLGSWVYLQF